MNTGARCCAELRQHPHGDLDGADNLDPKGLIADAAGIGAKELAFRVCTGTPSMTDFLSKSSSQKGRIQDVGFAARRSMPVAKFFVPRADFLSSTGNILSVFFRATHKRMAKEAIRSEISPYTSFVLDIARALAAGLVVLLHARAIAVGDLPLTWDYLPYAFANCGTPAVFWFFVISGYLVGGSAIAEVAQTGTFDFRRYLTNRMVRLYIVLLPALALGGALDSARHATWGLHANAGFETTASLSGATLIGNVLYLQTLLVHTFGSNRALWSLANEFWYYLIFPLLLAPLMIGRSPISRAFLFSGAALILVFICLHNISMAWLFTLWLLGALVRFCPILPMRSQLLAWFLAGVVMLANPILHPRIGLLATLLVGVTFANAILTSHGRTTAAEALGLPIVKVFAGFSFSLYLVHLPIQYFLATQIWHSSDPVLGIPLHSVMAPIAIIALVGVSYAVAFAFSRVTEEYTDNIRRRLLALVPKG